MDIDFLIKTKMINNTNKLTKYAQDLERYKTIVNYFEDNKERVLAGQNMVNLDRIYDSLIKTFPQTIDVSDKDIEWKVRMIIADRELNGLYSESIKLADRIQDVKCDSIIENMEKLRKRDDIGVKLKEIEDSRKEKKVSLLSQWIGELI